MQASISHSEINAKTETSEAVSSERAVNQHLLLMQYTQFTTILSLINQIVVYIVCGVINKESLANLQRRGRGSC